MEFMILNRGNVDVIVPEKAHILISICEPHKEFVELTPNKNRVNTLFQKYTDEDIPNHPTFGKRPIMTEEHAFELLEFVFKHQDQISMIICQCDGGVCRSSGTAAALSLILNGRGADSWVFENAQFIPNMWVYRMILNTFINRFSGEIKDI